MQPLLIFIGEGVKILKPNRGGVKTFKFSGDEKNENTVSIEQLIVCLDSKLNTFINEL